jgi:hypothetical protein
METPQSELFYCFLVYSLPRCFALIPAYQISNVHTRIDPKLSTHWLTDECKAVSPTLSDWNHVLKKIFFVIPFYCNIYYYSQEIV